MNWIEQSWIPWPQSRSQSSQQELPRRQGTYPRKDGATGLDSFPFSLEGTWTWFLTLLLPPSNYFSICYLCARLQEKGYFLMCTFKESQWISTQYLIFPANWSRLLPRHQRNLSLSLQRLSSTSQSLRWDEEGGIPVILDSNPVWIFP